MNYACETTFRRRPGCLRNVFLYVQIVGCVKGRYIYLVLIVDLNWLLL